MAVYCINGKISQWSIIAFLIFYAVSQVLASTPPTFVTLPNEPVTTVIENRRVSFGCRATGDTVPQVSGWLFNSARIRFDLSLYALSSDGTLTIRKAARSMAGIYQCIAKNSVGAVISRATELKVAYFDIVPSTPSEQQSVTLGSYVILNAPAVNCKPRPRSIWKKNGIQIQEAERISISENGNLYISNTVLGDGGEYVLEMENTVMTALGDGDGKQVVKKFDVTVSGSSTSGPQETLIIRNSPATQVISGTTKVITLECFISGSPILQTTMTWKKDGRVLTTSGPFAILPFKKRLQITNPTQEQEGDYTCEAQFSIYAKADRTMKLSVIVPPTLIESPADQKAFTDNTTTLVCNATAHPGFVVKWFRNALDLPTGPRFSVSQNNSLTISKLQWADTGMYQCIASNAGGLVIGTARLSIANVTTEVINGPMNTSIPIETTVELRCDVRGAPAPQIEWLKDSSRLDPTDARLNVKNNGYLQISNTKRSDSGLYTCIATNALGTDRASATLNVLAQTIITNIMNDTTTARKGLNVFLTCTVSHDPKITIGRQWQKGGKVINNIRYTVQENGNLKIRDIQDVDSGIYSCNVYSVAGNTSTTTNLQVIEPPLAPSTPVFKEVQARSLSLSWFAPGYDGGSPVIGYEIHMKNSSDSAPWYLLLVTEMGNPPQVVVDGLRPGFKYKFKIAAKNIIGRSRFSVETPYAETTSLAPSAAPQDISVTASGTDSILIKWKEPPPLDHNGVLLGYHVSYRLEGFESSGYSKITVNDANSRSYTIRGLPMFTKYEVKLSAFNKAGEGTESKIFTIETKEGTPSAAPTNVSVSVVNDTAVRVRFTSPPQQLWNGQLRSIVGYAWEPSRPQDLFSHEATYDPSSFTVQVFIFPNLNPFTQYALSVSVRTSSGESPKSDIVQFKTLEGKPDEPADVTISGVYSDAFTISWKPPLQIAGQLQGYTVRHRKSGEEIYHIIQEQADSKGAVVRGLAPQTHYEVDVQAYTGAGSGNRVSRTVITTDKPTLPGVPTNLKAFEINSTFIRLGFTPGDSGRAVILYFLIEYNNQSSYHVEQYPLWNVALNLTRILDLPAKIPYLRPNSNYRFRVTAYNSVGASPTSQVSDDVRTSEEAPSQPPSSIVATTPHRQAFLLKWIPPPKETWNSEFIRYFIQLVPINTTLSTITNIRHPDSVADSFLVRGLLKWTLYNITISIYNEVGYSPISTELIALTAEDVPAGPPTRIGARAMDDSRVQVTWGPIDNDLISGMLLGYRIIYNVKGQPSTELSYEVMGSTSFMATISGLYGYSDYEVRMLGFTQIGNGTRSAPIPVRTFEGVPGKPSRVRFPVVELDVVKISWRPPIRPNGIVQEYSVQYKVNGTTDAFQSVPRINSGSTVFSADVGGLAAYTYYMFRVRAKTRSGHGDAAEEVVYTTDKRGLPDSPVIPTIPLADVDERSVLVKWLPTKDNGSPIRSYSLQYNEERSGWKTINNEIHPSANQYHLTELTPSRSYVFRMKAANDVGNSSWSADSNTVTTNAAAPSGAPTNVRINAPSPKSLRVEWQAPNPVDLNGNLISFKLKFKRLGSTAAFEIIDLPATRRSYLIGNLEIFTAYEIALAARNNLGNGPWTPTYIRRTGESLPTMPPSNVRLEVTDKSTIKVTWNHPPEETKSGYPIGYKINVLRMDNNKRRRRDVFTSSCPDLGSPLSVVVASPQATSYELHSLRKHARYSISMLLYNGAGDGPSSPSYNAQTPGDVPGIPRLTKPKSYSDLADITWLPPCEPNGVIIGYQLIYGEAGGRQFAPIDISRHDRSLRLQPLDSLKQYTISLAARTAQGQGQAAKASFETRGTPQLPAQPGRPIAKGSNPDSIALQWVNGFDGNTPFLSYVIDHQPSEGAAWSNGWSIDATRVSRNGTTTWYTLKGLDSSTTYIFRITAVNRIGRSSPSLPSILIKTGSRVGGLKFYERIWFIVLVAMVVLLIIVIIIVCCCIRRRGQRKNKYVSNGPGSRQPGYGFSSFEMALVQRGESGQRLIPKDDGSSRNGSVAGGAKARPRPTQPLRDDEIKKDDVSVSSVSKHSDISDNDADKSADETEDERRRRQRGNGSGIASHYAHDPFHRSWRNSLDKKTRKALVAEYQKVKGADRGDNVSVTDSLLPRRKDDPMSASDENLERPRRRPGRPDQSEKRKLTQSEPDLMQDAQGTSSFSPPTAGRHQQQDIHRRPGKKPTDRSVARSEPMLAERASDSDSDPYASSSSRSKNRRKNSFLRATHGSSASVDKEKGKSKKDLAEELDRKLDYLWQAPPPYDSEEPPSGYDSEANPPPSYYSPNRREAPVDLRTNGDSRQPLLGGSSEDRGRQWRPQRRQHTDEEEPPEYYVDMDRRSVPNRHSDHLDGPISSQTLV